MLDRYSGVLFMRSKDMLEITHILFENIFIVVFKFFTTFFLFFGIKITVDNVRNKKKTQIFTKPRMERSLKYLFG